MPEQTANVATPTSSYTEDARLRYRPRLLMGGTLALLRAAGDGSRQDGTDAVMGSVLPRERGETVDEYRDRRDRSTLYNAFEEAVDTHVGRVFRNPPSLKDNVPTVIRGDEKGGKEGWWENVDLMGSSGDTFGRDWFKNAEIDGICCVLVDKPPAQNGEQSQADDERSGRRPRWVLVAAEDLIEAVPRYINGRPRLARCRIKRSVTKPDPASEWGEVTVNRIYVYFDGLDDSERPDIPTGDARRLAQFAVFEESKNDKGDSSWGPVPAVEGGSGTLDPLTFIPLVPFYTKRKGFFRGTPPLLNLADSNLEHFRKKSDLDNIMHVVNVPRLYRKGHRPETSEEGADKDAGAYRYQWDGSPEADMKYVEHAGQAIGHAQKDLEAVEQRMRGQALEPTLPSTGNLTATSDALRESKANSRLEAWLLGYADALELLLDYTMRYQGEPAGKGGEILVDRDIGVTVGGGQGFAQVFELAQALGLPDRFTLQEAKRYGVISVDWDIAQLMLESVVKPPTLLGKGLPLPGSRAVVPPDVPPAPPPALKPPDPNPAPPRNA